MTLCPVLNARITVLRSQTYAMIYAVVRCCISGVGRGDDVGEDAAGDVDRTRERGRPAGRDVVHRELYGWQVRLVSVAVHVYAVEV